MSRIAVYPGTFDPITQGHVDIILRAARLFDELIVAVAPTHRKTPYLSWEERVSLLSQQVSVSCNHVRVVRLEGLLVDFMQQQGARVIVRGLRTVSDFDYEFQLAHMNQRLLPTVETLFLPAAENTVSISATLVREILELGGDVSPFVPSLVASHLQQKRKKR